MLFIPQIGLGTYLLQGETCIEVVREALDLGYRHIDTAFAYENHVAIGKAIKGFPREKLFITSKILVDEMPHGVERQVELALKELGVDYIDLMLIHWPDRSYPLAAILSELQKNSKLRFTGVSNFTERHLQDMYDAGLKPAFNQVEFHPYLYQKDLLAFAKAHGTQLIAFRPFGKGKLLPQEPLFAEIGQKYGKTGAQIILRWILQKGLPIVPKASNLQHLKENIDIFDFSLTPEEVMRIDHLNKNQRFCMPENPEFNYH